MESLKLLRAVCEHSVEVGLNLYGVCALLAVTGGPGRPEGVFHHLQFALLT